jgi:hypothetical protein
LLQAASSIDEACRDTLTGTNMLAAGLRKRSSATRGFALERPDGEIHQQ